MCVALTLELTGWLRVEAGSSSAITQCCLQTHELQLRCRKSMRALSVSKISVALRKKFSLLLTKKIQHHLNENILLTPRAPSLKLVLRQVRAEQRNQRKSCAALHGEGLAPCDLYGLHALRWPRFSSSSRTKILVYPLLHFPSRDLHLPSQLRSCVGKPSASTQLSAQSTISQR